MSERARIIKEINKLLEKLDYQTLKAVFRYISRL